jgi:cation diffusion facilitator CzcD-associated flavoprotein CzcO
VSSHLYSYSFEASDWTREFAGQEEIHAYLVRTAQKWGLYKYIRFNTLVEEARWSDRVTKWEIAVRVSSGSKDAETSDSYTITSDFLVSAVGQLNSPHYPEIPGIDTFEGKLLHSARWDWNHRTEGKNIAVIGNGATAAQIIPEVAKDAKSVTVFQRTPNWVIPREDADIPQWRRNLYRYVPGARRRHRAELMDMRETALFNAIVTNDEEGKMKLRSMSLDLMKRQIRNNPKLIEDLTPDYPPGCKRVIISDDLFSAMDKPHVALETKKIQSISSDSITTENNEYKIDMIILATGFRTVEFLYPIKVYGLGGRSIQEIWQGGARAYLGMTVESLPNFAMLYGPNTNLRHNSIILMIEAQSRYISELIKNVFEAKAQHKSLIICPSHQTVQLFNEKIQEKLSNSTYADPACKSWYKMENGLITNNWSGTVIEYQELTSVIRWTDFLVSGSHAKTVTDSNTSHVGRVVEETMIGRFGISVLLVALPAAAFFFLKHRK